MLLKRNATLITLWTFFLLPNARRLNEVAVSQSALTYDYYLTSQTCVASRPSHTVAQCPPFGVAAFDERGVPLEQKAIEETCEELGFDACPERFHLLPDGTCGCENGTVTSNLQSGYVCQLPNNTTIPLTEDPMECLRPSDSAKISPFRACNSNSTALKSAKIKHYYSGFNKQHQQELEACATAVGGKVSDSSTTVDLHPGHGDDDDRDYFTQQYPFPLLYQPESSPLGYGFLECPIAAVKDYNRANIFWAVVGFMYVTGGCLLAAWKVYRGFDSTPKTNPRKTSHRGAFLFRKNVPQEVELANLTHMQSCSSFLLERDDTTKADFFADHWTQDGALANGATVGGLSSTAAEAALTSKTQKQNLALPPDSLSQPDSENDGVPKAQIGYRNSKFGSIAAAVVAVDVIALHLILLFVVLDFYGMHLYTFCDKAALARCRKFWDEQPDAEHHTLRLGHTCAAGCFLSSKWTTGVSSLWPYLRAPNGGHQIDVIFIIWWHAAVIVHLILCAYRLKLGTAFKVPCSSLSQANWVKFELPSPPEVAVETDESLVSRFARKVDDWNSRTLHKARHVMLQKIHQEGNHRPWISYQGGRLVLDESVDAFVPPVIIDALHMTRLAGGPVGLTSAAARERLQCQGPNSLDLPKPTIWESMAEEFFCGFYVYQVFCLWVWMAFYYWTVGLVILAAVMAGAAVKIRSKRRCLQRLRQLASLTGTAHVLRDGNWQTVEARHLVVGDVIAVELGLVPADCVLLAGRCVANESSLTGELTPVPKTPYLLVDGGPAPEQSWLAAGTEIQGLSLCVETSTGVGTADSRDAAAITRVVAVVIATGTQTRKGRLVRNMIHPMRLRFKFDQHWRLVFCILLLWGALVFVAVLQLTGFQLAGWYYGVSTISQILSPLVPTVFVAARVASAKRLRDYHGINCINVDRVMAAGKVKIACFDKTGTLTEGGLHLTQIHPIANQMVGSPVLTLRTAAGVLLPAQAPQISELVRVGIAVCNELTVAPAMRGFIGERSSRVLGVVGNEIDRRLFESTGFELIEGQTTEFVSRDSRHSILRRYPFDRATMTMSVVVSDGEIKLLFVKGSYDSMMTRLNPSTVPASLLSEARGLSRAGYYVISLAYRVVEEEFENVERFRLESGLTPLCLLVFSNEPKPEALRVIQELKAGSIRPIIISGDAALTAIKVGREVDITSASRILIGDYLVDAGCVEWRDFDTGELEPYEDNGTRWRDLELGAQELVLTGSAFRLLLHKRFEGPTSPPNGDASRAVQRCRRVNVHLPTGRGSRAMSLAESQLAAIARYVRIFARMTPDDKVQAVQLQMLTGVTLMCGDGANDTAAVRTAHVGVALGPGVALSRRGGTVRDSLLGSATTGGDGRTSKPEQRSDAMIAAPFFTPSSDLRSVLRILREGRCSLATGTCVYKCLMIYGEIMVALSFLMYHYGVNLSEAYWITIDGIVNVGMAWTFLQTKPAEKLCAIRPTSKLLGMEVTLSIVLQLAVDVVFMLLGLSLLLRQPFFACRNFDPYTVDLAQWWTKAENFEAEILALITLAQLINCAGAFNFGFHYRKPWKSNYLVWGFWALGQLFVMCLIYFPPSALTCLFKINCGDRSLMQRWTELGLLPEGSGDILTAPMGCPCDTQVAGGNEMCELEYLNCGAPHYNTPYHHNWMPLYFRHQICGLIILNCLIVIFIEGIFLVGPWRDRLRRERLKQRALPPADDEKARPRREPSVIVGHRRHGNSENPPAAPFVLPSGSGQYSDDGSFDADLGEGRR